MVLFSLAKRIIPVQAHNQGFFGKRLQGIAF
jgi:hypothetical protein